MSKVEVDQVTQQSGTTLTVGGGACKTAVVDATTVTLGRCGGTVSLASGATQSGFGRTGTVDWQTGSIKTTTFTAVNGEGYFANTSGGAFTMNLPAGSAGAIVSVVDYTNTFQTFGLTISPDGSEKIGGVAASFTADTEGQSLTFVYVDAVEGWKNIQDSTSNATGNPNLVASVSGACNTLTTAPDCANFKIAKFVNPGTFTVCAVSTTPANNTVSYLVVGGGGGGTVSQGGAGGAGGFREYRAPVSGCYAVSPLNGNPGGTSITVTATPYPITVGGGGAGNTPDGCSGVASTFDTVTSAGGGGGGSPGGGGCSGGSGGGSGSTYGPSCGGAGDTPPTTPAQGFPGGGRAPNPDAGGGAGGGATGAGPNGNNRPTTGAPGGAGASTSITGSSIAYAGGGGGGQGGPPGAPAAGGSGGSGGGGAGGGGGSGGQNGTDALGGGGGAGGNPAGQPSAGPAGNGGSGIVVIRYKFQ